MINQVSSIPKTDIYDSSILINLNLSDVGINIRLLSYFIFAEFIKLTILQFEVPLENSLRRKCGTAYCDNWKMCL